MPKIIKDNLLFLTVITKEVWLNLPADKTMTDSYRDGNLNTECRILVQKFKMQCT